MSNGQIVEYWLSGILGFTVASGTVSGLVLNARALIKTFLNEECCSVHNILCKHIKVTQTAFAVESGCFIVMSYLF